MAASVFMTEQLVLILKKINMDTIQNLFQYTIELLEQMSTRYKYTSFPSGAIMLDIWHKEKFYVVQFEEFIGISEINTDNVGFDTIPDEKFYSEVEYKKRINGILNQKRGSHK